jgi:DNA-binding beta-propeller fold protein YncE
MRAPKPPRHSRYLALGALGALLGLAVAATALAAAKPPPNGNGKPAKPVGTLTQLAGAKGCLVDRSTPQNGCGSARALKAPAPLLGSRALALSPDGKNLYVASSGSDAIAIFTRNPLDGTLSQAKGKGGCIALEGAGGCGTAIGLDGPNSVAVSPDGANVYATSFNSEAVAVFHRHRKSGALSQPLDGSGCIARVSQPGCVVGRGLGGPDVIAVSPDNKSVYAGSFPGNAIAAFNRDASTGTLSQPAGSAGCIAASAGNGCAVGLALEGLEGMAISPDSRSVYVGAATSQGIATLARDASTGGLTQATSGGGCIVSAPLAGCTAGAQLNGADAVTVSANEKDVYVSSLFSQSITSFTRTRHTGLLTQKPGTAGCLVFMRATGCSLGRAIGSPEGIAVSPDGASVYAASYAPGTIAVFNRNRHSGAIAQKPLRRGCLGAVPECASARGLSGLGSLVLDADGTYLYAAASKSNAITIFRRVTRQSHGPARVD